MKTRDALSRAFFWIRKSQKEDLTGSLSGFVLVFFFSFFTSSASSFFDFLSPFARSQEEANFSVVLSFTRAKAKEVKPGQSKRVE